MFKKLNFTIILFILLFLGGCTSDNGKFSNLFNQSKYKIDATKNERITLDLVDVEDYSFTMKIPKGWVYELNPLTTDFGIIVYDPLNIERIIFFYYRAEPFMKSQAAKNYYMTYYSQSNFAQTLVIDPPTVENFYTNWNGFVDLVRSYSSNFALVKYNNLEILERFELNNIYTNYSLDSATLRTSFNMENSNLLNEGLFMANVISLGSYYEVFGIDTYPLSVYNIAGISAPVEVFQDINEVLAHSLASFRFKEDYVRNYIETNESITQTILQNAQAMNEAFDALLKSNADKDISSSARLQKNSDAILGYDRYIDEDSGEIYRTELGWSDHYENNKDQFNKKNLRKIQDNEYDLYNQGIDYYIFK